MARESDQEWLSKVRKRFQLADESQKEQRRRELEDLRTYAVGPWSADDLAARGAIQGGAGQPGVPARPSLNIPIIQEPIRMVINDERSAELGIEIAPADDFGELGPPADETEIELREGLLRRIQRDSEALAARSWAFARAAIAGRGYWSVMTRYCAGKSWDQEVFIQRIYNQASVLLDPAHEQPDGSDAEWGFIGNDLRGEDYDSRWPRKADGSKNPAAGGTLDMWRAYGDDAPGWFRVEGDQRMVRVVDYWYTERESRTLVQLLDGTTAWKDELPPGTNTVDERRVIEKTVKWCQTDGIHILDETDWPTADIPIIEELGEELQPFDNQRRAQGMVRPSRDGVMAFDAMVSKLVETVGLSPIPPWQATPAQIEGFEHLYQMANTRALPVLYFNSVSDAGQPLGPPTRTPVDTPVTAIAGAIQLFRDTIQSTTGVHDPQLGKVDPSLKSGRAIKFLQAQSQASTSGFLSNHQRSIRREGHILNNLLFAIYGKRPGRLARIVNEHGDAQTVSINGPAPTNGKPVKQFQLTDGGNYDVIIKVGRTFESRRQEEASMLGDMISSNPQLLTVVGDLFFASTDGPGHLQIAERMKAILNPQIQAMLASKEQGADIPPAAHAQIAQMQQQLQEAHQLLQQAQQEISTKQAENETKLRIAQMEGDKDIRLQSMRDASALAVARINAMTKGIISDQEAQEERIALAVEANRTDVQHQHELRLAGHQDATAHAHEQHLAAQDRAHEVATMQLEHQQTMEQQQQAAELAPEPEAEPDKAPA